MLLQQMALAERRRVQQLEEQLFPPPVTRYDPPTVVEPPALTEQELLPPEVEARVQELPLTRELLLTPGLRPPMEPELEPVPTAEEQLAVELGWFQPRS